MNRYETPVALRRALEDRIMAILEALPKCLVEVA